MRPGGAHAAGARLIVANGGSTLLQAIACGAACVAVPIARDQRERIRRCAQAGVAVEAALDGARIAAERSRAAATTSRRAPRSRGARRNSALADGVEVAIARARSADRCAVAGAVSKACRMPYCWATISISRRSGTACAAWSAALEAAGWQVRTERFPSGRYGLRTWERRALLGWADVAVLHQIKLSSARGAAVRRVEPAADIRRGRCHLRAQAAAPGRAGRTIRSGGAESSRRPAAWVDVVAAGNEVLAGAARAGRAGSRDFADLDRCVVLSAERPRAADAPPTIVWIGSPENLVYLEMIRPALARLTVRHPALRLRVICSRFPRLAARCNVERVRVERGHRGRLARRRAHRRHAADGR